MADPVAEFFDALSRRGYDPLVRYVSGTVRFDVSQGRRTDHWLVALRNGDIEVAHRGGEADCVVSGDLALFEGMITGRNGGLAAVLRGALWVTGEPELLIHILRLLPGPQSRPEPPGRHAPPARPGVSARKRAGRTSTSTRDRRRPKPVSTGR
jgi:predicted lipid carrier protein YhbT